MSDLSVFLAIIFAVSLIGWLILKYVLDSGPSTSSGTAEGDGSGTAESDDEVLARAHRLALRAEQLAEAYRQARIVHDDDAVARLDAGNYDGPLPEQRGDGGWLSVYDGLRILPIAGINHRKGIGAYTGKCECALVPEPTNEFDPEAIKIVAEDGHHLGYVAQHHTQMVRSWASHRFPCYATAIINQHADELDGHTFYTGFIYVLINK